MELYQKQKFFSKYFLKFFSLFLNLDSILNILKKKITLIADVFLNLQTPKYVVR